MAFDIAPSSGDGPYFATASFFHPELIDGVNYMAELRTTISEGSCPPIGQATPVSADLVDDLIAGETIQLPLLVPSGSCRTYSLRIRRVSDSSAVSAVNKSIDNV